MTSEDKLDTPPLLTRIERVREFLSRPAVNIAAKIAGFMGGPVTMASSILLARHFAEAGDPNTVFKTTAFALLGVFTSTQLITAAFRSQIYIPDGDDAKKIIKSFDRKMLASNVAGTLIIGAGIGSFAHLIYSDAQKEKAEQVRVSALPKLDPQTILKPETAADKFCNAANANHVIAVKTIGAGGRMVEMKLACPIVSAQPL